MTRQRNAQFNQQHKREAPQASGILQRAAIRSVPRTATYHHTEDAESLAFTNSSLRQDFSRVSSSTTKSSQIMVKQKIGAAGNKYEQEADRVATEVASQLNTPAPVLSGQTKAVQRKQITRESEYGEGIGASRVDKKNTTGLPDNLKAGIENLSGMAMDDVKVHYNSSKAGEIQAKAYTQGTDIHVGQGQERYLAHEAWHVVQQKQRRVKETTKENGVAINDNQGLEKEADEMGERALTTKHSLKREKGSSEENEEKGGKREREANYPKIVQMTAYEDNLIVQSLKPTVNELEGHIRGGTLNTLDDATLQRLGQGVRRSIQYRGRVAGDVSYKDAGHAQRITIEQGWLAAVENEKRRRRAVAEAARRQAMEANLRNAPSLLPSGASWGKKKP
ncbi:DUF4157 domain-containing protein [uncultured Nostoc sp.]|uniref:eCIS core domain-containing protein n=1 Tax=uncultured Nostoc sp. TaxID=340711 RepID=UPI0035C9CD1D